MRKLLLITVCLALSVFARAQESRPVATSKKTEKPQAEKLQRDPAAVKAYESLTSGLYRPREHGLTSVRFQFEVKIELPDGRKLAYGPFQVDWNAKTGHKISLVGKWEKGKVKPEQMSPNFIDEMLNDFLGWEPAKLVQGRHVSLGKKNEVVVTLPAKEKKLTAIRKIVLIADQKGRLGKQSVMGEKDYPLMVREYDYTEQDKRTLVENVRIEAGGTRKVKSHTYAKVGDFIFPQKISSLGVEQGTREIVYSAIELPKKAAK